MRLATLQADPTLLRIGQEGIVPWARRFRRGRGGGGSPEFPPSASPIGTKEGHGLVTRGVCAPDRDAAERDRGRPIGMRKRIRVGILVPRDGVDPDGGRRSVALYRRRWGTQWWQ